MLAMIRAGRRVRKMPRVVENNDSWSHFAVSSHDLEGTESSLIHERSMTYRVGTAHCSCVAAD